MSKKIKDEQKKFLGETLNQYDKALDEAINQLDKKNREQNHKISSLVNSFDNEYLEKDVEGNMTTLENSKDGMVIINEIQGNTEVNYCKDGEKELILNGDIDTQGESFVTITEGVDGGLVDVSLEGNTEINLSKTKDPVLVTREFDDINCNVGKLQYTIDDVTTINDEPGKVDIDRIVGDTMVNHAVNGSEELILNAHINESGDNSIKLNGVTSDGGKVDVALEGNTMVNVCDQKDPVAITSDTNTFTLKYLYTSTDYIIQFESDTEIVIDITLGGTTLSSQNIIVGINKINITTPSKLIDNNLVLNGEGFNASNIVVTEAIDQDFGYFEGMKSVGECEDLEVVSSNSDGTLSNTQTLTHEPLRAVGDIKDKYVLIDGKWYIERNCSEIDISRLAWNASVLNDNGIVRFWANIKHKYPKQGSYVKCNILPNYAYATLELRTCEGIGIKGGSDSIDIGINLHKNKNILDSNSLVQWITNNSLMIIYQLASPTYEPIDYNPLEVYSGVTHITTNSTIPCNMVVKNHGYNMVALKEDTSYILYVNKDTTNALTYRLGDYIEINSPSKFTFTTPETLTDKTLRIDGKGTKVNDLMLIEGTPTNDSIGYFDGLKSSYECERVTDETDVNYGKYKVDVKVVGKNKFDKNKFINAELCTFNGVECVKVQDSNKYFKYYDNFKYNTQYTLTLKVYRDEGFIGKFFDVGIEYTDGTKSHFAFKHSEIKTITTAQNKTINHMYGAWKFGGNIYIDLSVAQLEEGNTATEYEPYFESIQTVYLNSPLLKGDEIVWKDNKIQHYHKMETVVFDGSDDEGWIKQGDDWDTNNRITFKISLPKSNLQWWSLENEISTAQNRMSKKVSSDKFTYIYNISNEDINEFIGQDGDIGHFGSSARYLVIGLLKAKLQTQNVVGFKQWLQQNPVKVVYELATPYYEEISDYPLKLNVIANSSLSTESTIQVTNISFNVYEETLPYLYPNTKYYITFNADVDRNNIVIDLGGSHVVFDCKVGFNKVEITTPSNTTNLLTFSGTGVNIDHVKVTQQDIDEYFEGMKSVGECENNTLEIICKNNDNSKSNTQTLTHEPLRAVGDVKDKYVLIDGKWYIERNCGSYTATGNELIYEYLNSYSLPVSYFIIYNNTFRFINSNCISNKFKNIAQAWNNNGKGIGVLSVTASSNENRVYFSNHTASELKSILNGFTIIYPLASPTYEPIDYNPLEVYSNITHISNNSLIPSNMVIKNHGYNTILKPSTTYTVALNKSNGTIGASLGGSSKVDSTNSVFTITTPSTLNDNVLRLSGSGKVKDIMILEGDKTVNTPSYFEGIESAFEQEYDTEKGKYRVTAKVEGDGKESNITFYINEQLRGTGTAKDRVFIQDGKVVVQRNYGSITLDGSEDIRKANTDYDSVDNITFKILHNNLSAWLTPNNILSSTLPSVGNKIWRGELEGITSDGIQILFCISRAKLQTQDIAGFKQWLQQNPITVVYTLAEPVYEEADCDLSKLVLENYENSSLIFESNIPVSANIRYSGEVPVVTQAKALSSKVDNTTFDINENIIPYMCDIDYRIVELQLMNGDTQGEGIELLGIGDIEILGNENVLSNNREDKKYNYSYDMLKRDILSQRYSKEEYQYRLDRYLLANKISNEEYKELEGLLNNGE